MSIPIASIRYAGVWNASIRYVYADMVISPIDSKNYVLTIQSQTGGSDPSVGLPWVFMPPNPPTGDITAVNAGTGLSGGGTSGSVTLTNIGVLNLDGQTGGVVTSSGQWYKTSTQVIGGTTGPNITSTITWDVPTSWSDTTTLAYTPGLQLWTVNKKGLYHLQCQVNFGRYNNPNFGDGTHLLNINIGRNLVTDSPIRIAWDWQNGDPTIPDVFVAGIYELQVGDKIQVQLVDHFQNTNTYDVLPQASGANSFDYNTFFTWVLIKPLP